MIEQWAGTGKAWSDGVNEMNVLLKEDDIHSHVTEVYSPPRVIGLASGLGLVPGMPWTSMLWTRTTVKPGISMALRKDVKR